MIKKLVILVLFVMFILIVGFATGWGNLWSRILGFFGGANVDTVVRACEVACTMQSQNDYCIMERKIRFEENTERNGKYNCKALEREVVGLNKCVSFEDSKLCREISLTK